MEVLGALALYAAIYRIFALLLLVLAVPFLWQVSRAAKAYRKHVRFARVCEKCGRELSSPLAQWCGKCGGKLQAAA